jgi:hypothetical protein
VLYYDARNEQLVYSANSSTGSTEIAAFQPSNDPKLRLKLDRGEVVLDVVWKPQPPASQIHLAAIVTSSSIRIISSDLQVNHLFLTIVLFISLS